MLLIGAILIFCILLYTIIQRESRTTFFAFLLFALYLTVAVKEVVGFPSLSEWQRLLRVEGTIVHPVIDGHLFENGWRMTDVANVLFFIPFGLLLPFIWDTYRQPLAVVTVSFFVSLTIEVGQLFTLYRVSDVGDLAMNTLGGLVGWVLYQTVFQRLFPPLLRESAYELVALIGLVFTLAFLF